VLSPSSQEMEHYGTIDISLTNTDVRKPDPMLCDKIEKRELVEEEEEQIVTTSSAINNVS
jgi:hypothetical protein